MRNILFLSLLAAMAICCRQTDAEVRVAGIFGDNMVLQREMELPVWGRARNGEKVSVELKGVIRTTTADASGKWMVRIGPFTAGGPCEMKVSGGNALLIKNILIGDVWLCSGQSNMEWGVEKVAGAETEIPTAHYPALRLTTVGGTSLTPQDQLSVRWVECSPATAGSFSAVGYYFGRELHQHLNVPMGLIANAVGASPIRAWISPDVQRSDPVFKATLEDYKTYAERKKAYAEKRKAYEDALRKSKAEGTAAPRFPGFFEAMGDGPGVVYNARIHPLAPFGIRGVVWYQGENEAIFHHAGTYREFFPLLIEDWRHRWGQGDFPFLFVQLAPIGSHSGQPVDSAWAEVRDGQRQALRVSNTAMAVTTDICESALHPRKKTDLGRRLALAARGLAYGERVEYSGPIFRKVEFSAGKAVVWFTHADGGLAVNGSRLKGFAIAGADRKFFWGTAEIHADRVSVCSDKVPAPRAIRYAWDDNPDGNLFNKDGLPASCFRTDDW
jgi:sialate O-acetylesterase